MNIDPLDPAQVNKAFNTQDFDIQGPIGEPEKPFAPTKKEFHEKLLEGFVMTTLRQMQQHDEAMKKAMKKARH